jgi:hypothetical protein
MKKLGQGSLDFRAVARKSKEQKERVPLYRRLLVETSFDSIQTKQPNLDNIKRRPALQQIVF